MLSASPAFAGDALWDVFVQHCLSAFEAVLAGDTTAPSTPFDITVTTNSCTASGGDAGDLARLIASRPTAYVEAHPGVWQSDLWREPWIEVTATADSYTVTETDQES
ncbi:hypothetical protein [Jannaschia donghaensis]|uniref:Uncharacterized protein n=1 Tax=Jannaschia donghaensis TaxID=420998 RepID=A0A0M6YIF7_9RHOB|nr:hypothetical protein [Jannaschia donghaensis]CTQ49559.1 hypothetical protein JDO7802_01573 [Jannaschia donghaensis]